MLTHLPASAALALSLTLLFPVPLFGADWPTDRHDAGRSAATDQELAATLFLQWSRELPPLTPAWPDQPAMQFDAAYNPVVLGKTLFVGSPRHDSVVALDAQTGAERWTFTTDGP